MRIGISRPLGGARCLLAAAVAVAVPSVGSATPLYWDINQDAPNADTTATGAWDGTAANFNTSSTGTGGTPTAVTTAADDVTFSSGTGHTGSSTVTVTGTQAVRSLTFEEGTLTFNGAGAIAVDAGGIIVNSGVGTVTTIGSGLNVTAPQTWTVNGDRQLTISGTAVINHLITLNGTGTTRFTTATNNSGAGGVTSNSGTLVINHANGIGTGPLTIGGGSLNTSGITLSNNNVQTWAGDFTFLATGGLNMGTGAVTLTGNRVVTTNGTVNALTVGGVISGDGFSLTKAGTGTMVLSGANTFTGGLTVRSGTLVAGISNATTVSGAAGPSTSAITLGDAALGTNAANLLASATVSNAVNLAANSVNTLTLGNNGGTSIGTFSGLISLNGRSLQLTATGTTGSAAFTGGITGTGNLTIIGSGSATRNFGTANALNFSGTLTHSPTGTGATTIGAPIGANVTEVVQTSTSSQLTLTNLANAFGALSIKAGVVEVQRTASGTPLGSASGVVTLGDAALNANAAIQFQGAAASFSNPILLGGGTGQMFIRTRNSGTGLTFSGGVTGTGDLRLDNGQGNNAQPLNITTNAINHTGPLTHATTGTGVGGVVISAVIGSNVTTVTQNSIAPLILSGANMYAGGTMINLGTLLANTASPGSATGSGLVTVNGGALGGTGRVAGPVTITSAGAVAPGALSGIGTLTIAADGSALTFADNATMKVQANGSAADLVNLIGTGSTVGFGNTWNLDISALAGDPAGQSFTLIDYTSTTDPALPATINFTGGYSGIVGIDAVNHAVVVWNLQAIPEPATAGLLALAGIGLLGRRRRMA